MRGDKFLNQYKYNNNINVNNIILKKVFFDTDPFKSVFYQCEFVVLKKGGDLKRNVYFGRTEEERIAAGKSH